MADRLLRDGSQSDAGLKEAGIALADRVERTNRKRDKEGPAGVATGYFEDA